MPQQLQTVDAVPTHLRRRGLRLLLNMAGEPGEVTRTFRRTRLVGAQSLAVAVVALVVVLRLLRR
ncbi:hypothetical protein CCB80_03315 [Armatimonadetes bacterium Uphvl-Ar1]|nr:hypothetical protein CCB80_03315 [Armatimonadetes bacterium Uphvl-Ar1]